MGRTVVHVCVCVGQEGIFFVQRIKGSVDCTLELCSRVTMC